MWCRLITGGESADAKPISWLRQNTLTEPTGGHPVERLYAETVQEFTKSPESDQRVSEAFQKGFREGEAAANQRLMSQVSAKVAQLAQIIEQLAL